MNSRLRVAQITRIALMGALLYASQVVLASLANVELVTLLIVVFTKNLGKEVTLACLVYVMLTALTWGFGLWWFTYLIVWPVFSLIVYKLRSIDSWVIWAIINGAFGLCFGAVFALPYLFVSVSYAFTYWVKGIPFDINHCIANFVIALLLGKVLDCAMQRVLKLTER